jgi:cellulose synthase/poly-beta-1,6-N-acetylglucosamine synthase-like glycosyltransferase
LIVITVLYVVSVVALSVFGFNMLALAVLYLVHRRSSPVLPDMPQGVQWPSVVVQLPIYNERHVVERLIDTAAGMDYPHDRLEIQVLDDSTDETTASAAAAIERHRENGIHIKLVRRPDRAGYKAGALAYGLTLNDAEFVAVFDADFVPRADFLRQTIPHMLADPQLGMVQTRWSHLNADTNSLTRAQALALDAHFAVEHVARQRSGLFTNFAGTGGIWRRRCIESSGGWQADTLSEDKDLSYRAQLEGWRCLHLTDVDSPGEIPPTAAALKRQQGRWTTGTVQCFLKLSGRILRARLGFWRKFEGLLHLGELFVYPLMFIMLLTSVPLMLTGGMNDLPLAPLGLAILGPPMAIVLAEIRLHRDWGRRLLALPFVLLFGVGMTVNNTLAVLRAFSRRPLVFERTPKYDIRQRRDDWLKGDYALPVDPTTWIELIMALYLGFGAVMAWGRAPGLFPFLVIWTLAFAYVALLGLVQERKLARRRRVGHVGRALTGSASR